MTANEEEEIQAGASDKRQLPKEVEELFEFLSFNNKIVFKPQQINDPDLERSEKVSIAREIFERNVQIFLHRFGSYFEEKHLNTLMTMEAVWIQPENNEEIRDMLIDYKRRLHSRKRDIKNRRYTAMQALIKEGEYFSELEMMKRAPEQYEELVGQYLSEDEIKQRDSYDVKNTTFSGIFMHQLEQQQKEEIFQEAKNKLKMESKKSPEAINATQKEYKVKLPTKRTDFEEEMDSDDEMADQDSNSLHKVCKDEYEVPKACQQQWGNFDSETIACSTSRLQKTSKRNSLNKSKKAANTFITAGERDLLRQEFVDFMHEQFLAGKDEDFDYTAVDDNTQLDDLSQINQDKEDAYFASSDEETADIMYKPTDVINDSSSEDELDVYMRHLSQHHSLKN